MQSPKNILLKSDRCLLKVFADTVCIYRYLLYLCVTHQKCTKYHRCVACATVFMMKDLLFLGQTPDGVGISVCPAVSVGSREIWGTVSLRVS